MREFSYVTGKRVAKYLVYRRRVKSDGLKVICSGFSCLSYSQSGNLLRA